ncbi:carbohydrate porin [Tanticharoenia sakaeratensis]|uniref:Carbohydrate-selective porin OprB n=1 Tax=Tanticharoenia sakaeratensis NBRC 103193 TaxID=1231623 RepID=A0A0D6MHC9_9PROT|nr:carbohydrate porin [Tanticharoenia sakaeratensis]GAN52901.1 carbohydrate-selective porin OprB [Tanticharoenia sakaeratensis NBRC 103193]GBQ18236.1 carbohydrate-selective porin B [Tanticharoenia sakaeratensis NBRC 103193]
MATPTWFRLGLRATLACTALYCVSPNAFAQSQVGANPQGAGQNSEEPSERVNAQLGQFTSPQDITPPLPQPEAILTDPFGWNTYLRNRGVAFTFDNTNEFTGAITKPTPGYGLRQGSSNAGQYSMESDIDWERLAGWRGFSTHAVIVGRYGIPASRMFGDNLNPSSEIYGAGGNVAVHFVYGYGEETLFNGHLDIIAGRIPFLNDFSSNPLYCNFMNNAFCGNPKASSDNIAHSSYPDAVWSTRIRVRPTKTTYIQTGVYFAQAGIYGNTQYRTGFKFNGADINGEAIPVEAGWEPIFSKGTLPGHYKLGFAWDTTDHKDTYYDGYGNPYVLSGLDPRRNHGSWAAWALADQMLYHHKGGAPAAGLTAIAGAYFNSQRTSTRAQQYEIGLLDRGFWASRPLDAVGANFSYVRVAPKVGQTQALQLQYDDPLLNGSYGVQKYGMVLELLYQIHVFRGVTFAPDFQYYWRPGAQEVLHNAAMLGFKSHIQFF